MRGEKPNSLLSDKHCESPAFSYSILTEKFLTASESVQLFDMFKYQSKIID